MSSSAGPSGRGTMSRVLPLFHGQWILEMLNAVEDHIYERGNEIQEILNEAKRRLVPTSVCGLFELYEGFRRKAG
jgi:hypothetical protein